MLLCCIYIVWHLTRMVANVILVNRGLCVLPARFILMIWIYECIIYTLSPSLIQSESWTTDCIINTVDLLLENILRLKFSPGKIYNVILMLSLLSLTGSIKQVWLHSFVCSGTTSEKHDWLLSPHRFGYDTKSRLVVLRCFLIGERTFSWLHDLINNMGGQDCATLQQS